MAVEPLTPELDLKQIIRDKLESSDIEDPQGLADALLSDKDIPRTLRAYGAALHITLPHEVREQIRQRRNVSLTDVDPGGTKTGGKAPRGGRRTSSRMSDITKAYQDRISSSAFPNGWKLVADMGHQDWLSAAGDDDTRIAGLVNARDRKLAVADLFVQHPSAQTTRDLPADEFLGAYRGE